MERKFTVENPKLLKLLTSRDAEVKKGREMQKEIDKLQQKQRKVGYKLNRVKEQVVPLVEEYRSKVGEFEDITKVEIEDGKVTITVVDLLEEAKAKITKAKAEYAKKLNPEKQGGDSAEDGGGQEAKAETKEA